MSNYLINSGVRRSEASRNVPVHVLAIVPGSGVVDTGH